MADRDADLTGEGDVITPEALARVREEAGERIEAHLKRCFKWPLDGCDPEDVLQEAYVRLLTGQRKFDSLRTTLEAYYQGACVNVAQERLREQLRHQELFGPQTTAVLLEQIPARDPSADERPPPEHAGALREAIAKLPQHERDVIDADLEAGGIAPSAALARKLRISNSTVRKRRSRAHRNLRDLLAEDGLTGAFD